MFGTREGAHYLGEGHCRFSVWAPHHKSVEVHLIDEDSFFPMRKEKKGHFLLEIEGVRPQDLYTYRVDGARQLPDPTSLHQPYGVHGPSAVVDTRRFCWQDHEWSGIDWEDLIIYQLHVGTFTPEGTLDAIISQLPYLSSLGITAIQLMPVAQFAGTRNWGYDGVFPYAVQDSYGGPAALQRLVNACHEQGLAIFLDVVYNHLGPEGNVLPQYGPYFSDKYCGPWGRALNFDGPHSDEVRRYFVNNAIHWVRDFHVDGLRLDAIHGVFDQSAVPFLQELTKEVRCVAHTNRRRVWVIAESDLNDPRVLLPASDQGLGMDGQWNDDFHHALHAVLTGESDGYYRDFGQIEHIRQALDCGYVYSGQYSPYRKRRHGAPLGPDLCRRLVVFSQNHDQVGNRQQGERLAELVSQEKYYLAAGAVLLSPFVPLLFMGEEYGEKAPFLYFTSHSDDELIERVRQGRQREFSDFSWPGDTPDPQATETFRRSCLRLPHGHKERDQSKCLQLYRSLVAWRSYLRPLRAQVSVGGDPQMHIWLRFRRDEQDFFLILNYVPERLAVTFPPGRWQKRLDTSNDSWPLPPGKKGDRFVFDSERVEGYSLQLYEKMGGTDPA